MINKLKQIPQTNTPDMTISITEPSFNWSTLVSLSKMLFVM